MNINLTIVAQAIVFLIFIWFCARFIWPPLIAAMRERQRTIAEGLENAESAQHQLDAAEQTAKEIVSQARTEANQITAQARNQAATMVEEAKHDAREEGERLKDAATAELEQEVNKTREALRAEVAALAVAGAQKILESQIDESKHRAMLDKLAADL